MFTWQTELVSGKPWLLSISGCPHWTAGWSVPSLCNRAQIEKANNLPKEHTVPFRHRKEHGALGSGGRPK